MIILSDATDCGMYHNIQNDASWSVNDTSESLNDDTSVTLQIVALLTDSPRDIFTIVKAFIV
jgi:hypothetical protein